jgi:type IV pilus assembly protein PilN
MYLDINLASQPYQDVRRFVMRASLVLFAAVLLTAALAYAAVAQYRAWRATNRNANQLREQIARVDAENRAAAAFLNKPENRGTRDRSQFLNELIARKTFSWTNVLADLERIMPPQVYVTSIRPSVNDRNELQISLVVEGHSRESALELVRHMEGSPDFHDAHIDTENIDPNKGEAVKFVISADYVPDFARVPEASPNAAPEGRR